MTEYVPENYTFKSVEWCCEDAGREWLACAIGFGYHLSQTVQTRLVVTRSNIAPFARLGEGSCEITRCPYCNKEITIMVEERT